MKKPGKRNANRGQKQSDGYDVGYGRPPVHTRFKPGQSGNRKGRPKGRKKLGRLLDAVLNEQVSIREGDAIRKVSKAEAMVRAIILKAMKGDTKAYAMLIALCREGGEFEKEMPPLVNEIKVSFVKPNKPSENP